MRDSESENEAFKSNGIMYMKHVSASSSGKADFGKVLNNLHEAILVPIKKIELIIMEKIPEN